MMSFLIPKLCYNTCCNIECIEGKYTEEPVVSNSLNFFLKDIKKKISIHGNEWDIYKKYTNPFEFVHTQIPFKNKSIGKYHPLSRSYFKMIEITKFFELDKCDDTSMQCFHLAEGPGGFIEALVFIRENKNDVYTGMTLIDDSKNMNIPAWKKSNTFLRANSNVFIEKGADGTGNIISMQNLNLIEKKYGDSMHLITADGGFDFSTDFDNQESNMTRLLFSQIVYAVSMQKQGGSFVLKVFDIFMSQTVDMIAILSSLYEKVFITKPHTSRYANSEKYIVCIGFSGHNRVKYYPIIRRAFDKMIMLDDNATISRFLTSPIPYIFMSRLDEYNAIFGQRQLENIHSTITLIQDSTRDFKITSLQKINIHKCIRWCIHHGVPYNNMILSNNFNNYSQPRNCFLTARPVIS